MAMHLANAISYITDEEKTQSGSLVGSHNCNADTALQEMLATKRKFGKMDKRQGCHFIISFRKQEVRPETAMEITQKFVERYFGDDFQCLYATHDNTEHVHSHILFNSVSWRTGKKYRYEKGDWAKEIQPIVNELCKEYGLSIQDIEVGTEEKALKKWDKTKQGIFKWNHQIKLDVEDSISFANSYDNFLKLMEPKGYEIKQKNGETFLKPMGEKRFIRLTDISAYYTKEAIDNQIENRIQSKISRSENPTPRIVAYRKNYRKYISQSVKVTIAFDADGGKEVNPIKAAKGAIIRLPKTEKEGYRFLGWYTEKDGGILLRIPGSEMKAVKATMHGWSSYREGICIMQNRIMRPPALSPLLPVTGVFLEKMGDFL